MNLKLNLVMLLPLVIAASFSTWTELTNALEAKVKKIAMKAETLYTERCNSVCEALSYHGCSKV
jgi:hypothetical protein